MLDRSSWGHRVDHSDRIEFVRVLNGLAAVKRVDLTKEVYEIWWQSMKDWSIEAFRDAAGYLLKNCQFMPSPYDFEQLRKKSETSPSEAWSLALRHAEGNWRHGPLGDALIDRAVAMLGGSGVIALTNMENLGFLERRFRDAYDDLRCTDSVRKALPGFVAEPRIQSDLRVLSQGVDTECTRSDQDE